MNASFVHFLRFIYIVIVSSCLPWRLTSGRLWLAGWRCVGSCCWRSRWVHLAGVCFVISCSRVTGRLYCVALRLIRCFLLLNGSVIQHFILDFHASVLDGWLWLLHFWLLIGRLLGSESRGSGSSLLILSSLLDNVLCRVINTNAKVTDIDQFSVALLVAGEMLFWFHENSSIFHSYVSLFMGAGAWI